jgi:hypothetical protein
MIVCVRIGILNVKNRDFLLDRDLMVSLWLVFDVFGIEL